MYDQTRLYEIDFSDSCLSESELAEYIGKMDQANKAEQTRAANRRNGWHSDSSFMGAIGGGKRR